MDEGDWRGNLALCGEEMPVFPESYRFFLGESPSSGTRNGQWKVDIQQSGSFGFRFPLGNDNLWVLLNSWNFVILGAQMLK